MIKEKCLVTFNNSNKLFCCAFTELKEKTKDLFDIQGVHKVRVH